MFVGLFGETNAYDVLRCKFTAPDGTLLTAYPWTDPDDYRVWSAQWVVSLPTITQPELKVMSNRAEQTIIGGTNRGNSIQSNVSDCTIRFTFYTGKTSSVAANSNRIWQIFRIVNNSAYWISAWSKANPSLGNEIIYLYENGAILRASISKPFIEQALIQAYTTLSDERIITSFDGVSVSYNSAVNKYGTIHGVGFGINTTVQEAQYLDNYRVSVP